MTSSADLNARAFGADVISDADEPAILPIVTFVLWMLCFGVGVIGLALPYPRRARLPEVAPVETTVVPVQLDAPPSIAPSPITPPPTIGAAPDLAAPSIAAPAAPAPIAIPPAPETAVAAPSASIAFAVPVEGFLHIVDAKEAGYQGAYPATPHPPTGPVNGARSASPGVAAASAVPAVTHLTFGEGEGNQPPPDYPRDAQLAGQQGSVGLRFTVNASGRVTGVSTISPSHWPLLNRAAIQVIRDRWRFAPGPARTYDVSIEFQLQP